MSLVKFFIAQVSSVDLQTSILSKEDDDLDDDLKHHVFGVEGRWSWPWKWNFIFLVNIENSEYGMKKSERKHFHKDNILQFVKIILFTNYYP